jgi:hypothetical protein
MTSALVSKELRETAGIALVGLAALLLLAMMHIGWSPLALLGMNSPWRGGGIPFIGDNFVQQFALVAFGLAAVLGFRQAVVDFSGDAQHFLLHLPVSRQQLYLTKLLVGLLLYLVCGVLPILLYACWAATPGTHPSPFEWSMTSLAWMTWLAITAVYLGAFLAGIRPAAWFGTRLAPLAASVIPLAVIAVLSVTIAASFWPLGLLVVAAFDVLLVVLILFVVQTRDFA